MDAEERRDGKERGAVRGEGRKEAEGGMTRATGLERTERSAGEQLQRDDKADQAEGDREGTA